MIVGRVNNIDFIFFHIQNTAGKSITSGLAPYAAFHPQPPVHSTPLIHPRLVNGEFWRFTFVRNPWDWQVSQFFQLKAGITDPRLPASLVEWFKPFTCPADMVRARHRWWKESGLGVDLQTDWSDHVQTVYRFENLEEDWKKVLLRLKLEYFPLPYLNKHKEKK